MRDDKVNKSDGLRMLRAKGQRLKNKATEKCNNCNCTRYSTCTCKRRVRNATEEVV